MKIKYFLLLVLITQLACADPTCVIKGGGIFDGLLLQVGNLTQSWQDKIEPLAKKFFFILFGMEFMWQLTVKKVFAGDIEKLWVFFFTRTVLCFFFAQYLVNIEMYKGIITFFSNLGSDIGGVSLNMASSGTNPTMIGPSAVVSSFSCITDMIHTATDQTGAFQFITVKITLAIMQVVMFFVLIIIAFYLMCVILQAYIMVYIGFLFAGFAGSSWTMDYWQRYLSAIIAIGCKFLVVCILMGVFNAQMQSWANDINQAINSDLGILSAVVFRSVGTAFIMALSFWYLPEWFAASITGQIMLNVPRGVITNPIQSIVSSASSSLGGGQKPGGMATEIYKPGSTGKANPFGEKK